MAGEKRAPHVLVVEDDADINESVAVTLERAGMVCTRAFSGSEARLVLSGAPADAFDLVVCDLMLPGEPGEQLVGELRASGSAVPVLVISARGGVSDRVDLLRLGADDYLVKPFDLEELEARAEALLRRAGAHRGAGFEGEKVIVGAWELDPAARTLAVAGAPVPLTRTEYGIVELLARHPSRVFTKQELFETVWGEPYAAGDATVTSHVSNLRAKLRPSGTDGYIRTVWGIGFKLDVQGTS